MKATNYRHFENNKNKKTHAGIKLIPFAAAVAIIAPITMLSSNADVFNDGKIASYAEGNSKTVSKVISNNYVPTTTVDLTRPNTANQSSGQSVEKIANSKMTSKAEKTEMVKTQSSGIPALKESTENKKTASSTTAKVSSGSDNKAKESSKSEPKKTETKKKTEASASEENTYNNNSYTSGALIDISNPDPNYAPQRVYLSEYDRALCERLVMGEGGNMGFEGCAMIAQAIRDAMNRSNAISMDYVISNYGYYGYTGYEPNQDVKDAVSFIFDQNGSAVQHRVMVFYTGESAWHETQLFLTQIGTVRFFDILAD